MVRTSHGSSPRRAAPRTIGLPGSGSRERPGPHRTLMHRPERGTSGGWRYDPSDPYGTSHRNRPEHKSYIQIVEATMNTYCPECETELDQTTGVCPACRWDPYLIAPKPTKAAKFEGSISD